MSDISSALDCGGRDAGLLFQRGVLLDETGRRREADAALTEALMLEPEHAGALNSRGIVRMQLGDLSAAKADLDKAVRLSPDWEVPYVNRSQVETLLGNPAAARDDCSRAIETLASRDRADERSLLAKLHWNRAVVLEELGDLTGAEADRQTAHRLDPQLTAPGA